MWKIIKDLSCTLSSFLKRIAKKVLTPWKRRTKSMINTMGSSERLIKEDPKTLRRVFSCPTISPDQATQIETNAYGDDINQGVKSISKKKKNKNKNRQKKRKNGKVQKSCTTEPKEEEEDTSSKIKRNISNALTIGLIGAKAASFFFAIKSFIGEENIEEIDIDA